MIIEDYINVIGNKKIRRSNDIKRFWWLMM